MTDPPPRPGAPRPGRRPAGACARAPRAPSWSTARSGSAATPRPSSARCEQARVIGIDRDPAALALAGERLAPFGDRFTGVHAVVRRDPRRARRPRAWTPSTRVLFDLGVSSMQLDVRDARLRLRRGRAAGHADGRHHGHHRRRGPQHLLGRRADPGAARVRRGEVRPQDRPRGRPRARDRARSPLSARLVELLYAEIPAPARRTGGHPAKRTFQALRMEVNDELAVLRRAIPAAIDVDRRRRPRGRRVLPLARGPAGQAGLRRRHPPRRARRTCRSSPRAASRPCGYVTRGAEQADEHEIEQNPRAASVRLRAVERVLPSRSLHRGVTR